MNNTSEIRGWITTGLWLAFVSLLSWAANDMRSSVKDNFRGIRTELEKLNHNVQKLDKSYSIQDQRILGIDRGMEDHEKRIRALERRP